VGTACREADTETYGSEPMCGVECKCKHLTNPLQFAVKPRRQIFSCKSLEIRGELKSHLQDEHEEFADCEQ
jgi:hypothetical protein